MSHDFGPDYEKNLSKKIADWPPKQEPQPWWRKLADELYFVDDFNNQDAFNEMMERIITEAEKRERDRVLAIIERDYAEEAELNKHCEGKTIFDQCKDCRAGAHHMAMNSKILAAIVLLPDDWNPKIKPEECPVDGSCESCQ